jgi:predicted SAM-dependent methyltransferase
VNLYDMLRRKDRNLLVSGQVAMAKAEINGELWRGVNLAPGSAIRIVDARRFVSLRAWPRHCGWMVETPPNVRLDVTVVRHGTDVALGTTSYSGGFQPLNLPWPRETIGDIDLVMAASGSGKAPAFLANHRALSRAWLLEACVGKGIEIGPGAQPQVLPGPNADVCYLEQMPPEEWNRLYNGGGKYTVRPELWDNYLVGEASALPVADGSLDFLFGSHVFEHLANPVGHLARWQKKLAKGGKVICVVPDLAGTKDAVQERSTLAEWLEEFSKEIWLPTEAQYVRHLRRPSDDKELVAAMERMESIHVHYYDNINCQQLLDFAVRELGYADYIIEHTPNHKDFHFVLVNK